MKKLVFSVMFINSLLLADSHACRYEVNEKVLSEELIAVGTAGLAGGGTILETRVSDFNFFESKPTAMCPKEVTYSIQLTSFYQEKGYIGSGYCKVKQKVTKIEPFGRGGTSTYKVKFLSEECSNHGPAQ